MDSGTQTTFLTPTFGEGFIEDHAGKILTHPDIAIVELVANSWDAGATKVDIIWPTEINGVFQIRDNGSGMTKEEFESIWPELTYNRVKKQGIKVQFPESSTKRVRSAYGRNGKGRHSLFCFSKDYFVETWKEDIASQFQIKRSHGKLPYEIRLIIDEFDKEGHGTKIWTNIDKNYISVNEVGELLGSKFITDPDFEIVLNHKKIVMNILEDAFDVREYEIPGEEEKITILIFDSKRPGRLSKHHGVAWWVNNRLVGEHSWKGLEGAYLDGRTTEAKRYSVIVLADLLHDELKSDWTGFIQSPRTEKIIEYVNDCIFKSIHQLMRGIRSETKKVLLTEHKDKLETLSGLSKDQIGTFIDGIQMKCPRMTHNDLSNTIEIFTKMEMSRTGYGLLQQLVKLSPNDIDGLSKILEDWSIHDARQVLDELKFRLELIKSIENRIDDPTADELHELQPLFEKGLWIFGPEYEGIQFTSNKSLLTVIREFFGDAVLESPLKRPDFVALPDSSISLYNSDDFDENGEVCGIKRVIIIELKRGGSTIKDKERRQAEDYAKELIKSGKIGESTEIIGYVLGSSVDTMSLKLGEREQIKIFPLAYNIIIRKANARTFYLIDKISSIKGISRDEIYDKEMRDVFAQKELKFFTEEKVIAGS